MSREGSRRDATEKGHDDHEAMVINEIKLLLAEKRTSLASMRTGIAVFTLPLSVLSVLVATSRLYDFWHVLPLLVPLLGLTAGLVALGIYLVTRAVLRTQRYDRRIRIFECQDTAVAELLEVSSPESERLKQRIARDAPAAVRS